MSSGNADNAPRLHGARFVILRHEMPATSDRPSHWDFMLEQDGALRTWALDQEPSSETTTQATELPPHRLAYLDYEGPVSGDRGQVTRWDAGNYWLNTSSESAISIELAGTRLVGIATLTLTDRHDYWTFRFSSGKAATSG